MGKNLCIIDIHLPIIFINMVFLIIEFDKDDKIANQACQDCFDK